MHYRLRATAALCLLFLLSSFAFAATPANAAQSYLVLPFTVNGPSGHEYLSTSLATMLSSRLHWQGNFEAAQNPGRTVPAADDAAAEAARKAAGADYIIWGSVTIIGTDCSLDLLVRDAAGNTWPNSRASAVDQIIPALKESADSINAEIFGRPSDSAIAIAPAPARRYQVLNPQLAQAEGAPEQPYMNPQLRFAGNQGDGARLRSQNLPFASVGMEICDADGDGKNEVFILTDHQVLAYRFDEDNMLEKIGGFDFSRTQQGLAIRSLELDSLNPRLVVTAHDEADEPSSRILTFDGANFTELARSNRFFLNVVKLPPLYDKMLIGQFSQAPHLFRGDVFEVEFDGDELRPGKSISLPDEANVFNFAYIPPNYDPRDVTKILLLTEDEHLRLYTENGTVMTESEDRYSGAVQGLSVGRNLPGLGRDDSLLSDIYYIPMRMEPISLKHDGNYEVLVNRPTSTAGRLFSRYRSFPESEIHSMYWDGVGLNMLWETPTIRGNSVADYTIADANNDGLEDLSVLVNTHPGALGLSERRTAVLLWPLDFNQIDPDATIYRGE